MSVKVIDTLKPKNNGSFPVAEAVDIAVTDEVRLPEALAAKADASALEETTAAVAEKANASDVATATANLQGQINQIEISASAESVVAPEVAAARVGDDGTEYNTLKERLDAENSEIRDAFSEVKYDDYETIQYFTQGGINTNTGENIEATTRCRASGYISFATASSFVKFKPKNTYKFNLFEYDSDLNYVKNFGWTDVEVTRELNKAYFYRIAVAKTDDSDITPANVPGDVLIITRTGVTSPAIEKSPNIFKLTVPHHGPANGITLTTNADGTITINGTATATISYSLFGAGTDEPNLDAGKTYIITRELVSGTENNGNPYFSYKDTQNPSYRTVYVRTLLVAGNGACLIMRILGGYSFTNARYKFSIVESEYPMPIIRQDGFTAKDDIARYWIKKKKSYSRNNIYFSIETTNPLPFGSKDVPNEISSIECVLRLPTSYSENGKPTRLVLCCHGSGGYIKASDDKWWSANWMSFIEDMIAEGYACFDCNLYPTTQDNSAVVGEHYGSPIYVANCKKAYDYIVENYNVYPEIFVHGCSMGGVAATAFAHVYPKIVLAESSFAGRDFVLYLWRILNQWGAEDKLIFANTMGYASFDEMMSDKMSHCEGFYPSLSLAKILDGAIVFSPDRNTEFSDWLEYYASLEDYSELETPDKWFGKRKVPYKAWNSWNDREGDTKLETILQSAYNTLCSCVYYNVIYDNLTHSQLCYGQQDNMVNQLVAFYKQFE